MLSSFVDFYVAFPYINRDWLLRKLQRYGIRVLALNMFSFYLKYRRQYAYTNSDSFNVQPTFSGIPRGSILGPLAYNIYINDIVTLSAKSTFFMYNTTIAIFRW